MIEPLKIINEISGYKTLKLKHLERYDFKKSDNAYLVKTGALLSFGKKNFTQLLGKYDPIGFSEVILATSATVEGQTTAHYIIDRLEELRLSIDADFNVSRLAQGVPIGGELEYLDDGTLSAALKARRPV